MAVSNFFSNLQSNETLNVSYDNIKAASFNTKDFQSNFIIGVTLGIYFI